MLSQQLYYHLTHKIFYLISNSLFKISQNFPKDYKIFKNVYHQNIFNKILLFIYLFSFIFFVCEVQVKKSFTFQTHKFESQKLKSIFFKCYFVNECKDFNFDWKPSVELKSQLFTPYFHRQVLRRRLNHNFMFWALWWAYSS